jgi:hypothetical protein
VRILALLLVTFPLSACATVIYGDRQDVLINTAPQDATAEVDGNSCTTPCELNMSKKETSVSITKDGYDSVIYPLTKRRHFGAHVPGNIFNLTFGLGIFYDLSTGGHYEIQPVDARLEKKSNTE